MKTATEILNAVFNQQSLSVTISLDDFALNNLTVSGATTLNTLNANSIAIGGTDIYSIFLTTNDGNTYTTGGTYSAGYIYFSGNAAGSSFSVDVRGLLDDTNTFLTGGTMTGDTLILTRNDGGEISIDLSQFNYNDEIDSHTGDTTIHYTKDSISIFDLGTSAHTHTVSEIVDIEPAYKIYSALLSQNAPIPSQTGGTFTVGQIWTITTYVHDDDFSNMELISGSRHNETGAVIRATSDTPTVWVSSDLSYDGAPYIVSTDSDDALNPFENTLGGDIVWSYVGEGEYNGALGSPTLTLSKTWMSITTGSGNLVGVELVDQHNIGIYSSLTDDVLDHTPIEIRLYN